MKISITDICSLVARALEVDSSIITAETKASEVELWDSLGQISILSEIDKTFDGVTERCPALASANSVREIFDALYDAV